MSDKRDEILNRLRKAKKDLQDSLQSEDQGIKKAEKVELVEGQKEIEKVDRIKEISETPEIEESEPKTKKLYKASEKKAKRDVPKELKSNDGLSTKKLAAIQRNIRKKVISRQQMTSKQKALVVIAIVFAAMPLAFLNTLSVVSCRFDFNNFGLYYRGTPGSLMMTIPVTNPSFVPAHLGELELELFDANMSKVIARVGTNEKKRIEPFATVVIDIALRLDPDSAGDWISGLFKNVAIDYETGRISGMDLYIYIRNFKYNGMLVTKEVVLPKIPLSDILTDLTGGLSFSGSGAPIASRIRAAQEADNVIKGWRTYQENPLPSMEMELVKIKIDDTPEAFNLTLEMGVLLEPLKDMFLGPINIKNLSVSLYANEVELKSGKREHYTKEVARLETLHPDEVTDVHYKGLKRDKNSPIEIHFGTMSFISARLYVFKDNIGSSLIHPSYYANFSTPELVEAFVQDNATKLPVWNFFNSLLNGNVDSLIEINTIDLNIFGIDISDLEIKKELMPIIQLEGLFDLSDLTGNAPVGIFGMLGFYSKLATQSVLGMNQFNSIYPELKASGDEEDPDAIDASMLGDMIRIEDFDTNKIKETMDEITLGLGISINNSKMNLFVGMYDVMLGLSYGSNISDPFAVVSLVNTDNTTIDEGKTIFINGKGSVTNMSVDLVLRKSGSYGIQVGNFIRDIFEQFRINARATLVVENLFLFREKYKFTGIQLSMDMGGLFDLKTMVEDLVGGAINGALTKKETDDNETVTDPETPDPFDPGMAGIADSPLFYPFRFMIQAAIGNPVMSSLLGIESSLPGTVTMQDKSGETLDAPDPAVDVENIEIKNHYLGTEIFIGIANIEIPKDTIPIYIAMGQTSLVLKSNDQYGNIAPIISLNQNNYVEISDKRPFNIYLSMIIHHGATLCNFLSQVLRNGSFSLYLEGSFSINVSGVWIPDIKLNLGVGNLSLGADLTVLLNEMIADLAVERPDAIVLNTQVQNTDQIKMWDGRVPLSPFQLQSAVGPGDFLKIGKVELQSITESGWPYVDQGTVEIRIHLGVKTDLMDIELNNVYADLRDDNGNLLATITLENSGSIYLIPGIERILQIKIQFVKSEALQSYLADLLTNLKPKGLAYASLDLKIFGCAINQLNATVNLTKLDVDVSTLLTQINPISPYTLLNSPMASEDVIDILGDFGILYVQTGGKIEKVGPNNPNDPMFNVVLGMALQPKLNMSIMNADLQLLDKGIFDSIYQNNSDYLDDAISLSKIARVYIDPVWCNTTYGPGSNATFEEGVNYWDVRDPNKPYWDVSMNNTGKAGIRYIPGYNETSGTYYEPMKLGSFAFTEAHLEIYNQSHGSFRNAYPKKYWRSLGGPYFPVQVYGKSQGGYPDHKVIYHPYYSPVANLFSQISTAMDDPMALLSKLTLAGNITINLFSMNLTLDTRSPAVTGLMSALLEETQLYFRQAVSEAANPLARFQAPTVRRAAVLNKLNELVSGTPLSSRFEMQLSIDLESIIDNYPLIAIDVRNDHMFAPYLTAANDLKYMGNNIKPYDYKGRWRADYTPGLYHPIKNPGGSQIESFAKDYYYESYKLVMENWRESKGLPINPFFETENKTHGNIEDHTLWPLRYNEGKGRTPSWLGVFVVGLIPRFEIGILSAYMNLWYDDPITGCDLVPLGYAWINNSVNPRPATPEMPFPAHENGGMIDDNGHTALDCNWVILNVRLFYARQTQAFFYSMFEDIENFNLSLVLDAKINATMFGYEFYNVVVGGLTTDDRTPFVSKCKGQYQYTEEGNIWGLPGEDGSLGEIKDTAAWPPKHTLPRYSSDAGLVYLGDFGFDSLGFGFGGIDEIVPSVRIRLDISIDMPLTVHAWLSRIFGRLMVDEHEVAPHWQNVTHWSEQAEVDSGMIYLCLNRFDQENLANPNPYDLRLNTITKNSVYVKEEITTPPIYIQIQWQILPIALRSINLWKLITEQVVEFTRDTLWIQVQDLTVEVLVVQVFDYKIYIPIPLETLTFDLVEMLDGTQL